jgi:hypothetical protein
MIHFRCPACGHSLKAERMVAGRKTRCTRCFKTFSIPGEPPKESAWQFDPPPGRAAAPEVEPAQPANPVEFVVKSDTQDPVIEISDTVSVCPRCAKEVNPFALECRYCGELLDPTMRARERRSERERRAAEVRRVSRENGGGASVFSVLMMVGGALMLCFGCCCGLSSLAMDTSVESGYGRVHNLSLAHQQLVYLIVSVAIGVCGLALFALGSALSFWRR